MGKKSKTTNTSHHPYGKDNKINENTMKAIRDTIKLYDDNKYLDKPQNKIIYPDYIFEMEETKYLRNYCNCETDLIESNSTELNSFDYQNITWNSLKNMFRNEYNFNDRNFNECLWLYIQGCPNTITTKMLFKYDVCNCILDTTKKNFGKYNTVMVTNALIDKGYTKNLANKITECTHYNNFEDNLIKVLE